MFRPLMADVTRRGFINLAGRAGGAAALYNTLGAMGLPTRSANDSQPWRPRGATPSRSPTASVSIRATRGWSSGAPRSHGRRFRSRAEGWVEWSADARRQAYPILLAGDGPLYF